MFLHLPNRFRFRATCPALRLRLLLVSSLSLAAILSPLRADTIMDHSTADIDGSSGWFAGGNWLGFEFTTPSGSAFDLDEIQASFGRTSDYTGNTDIRLFTLSGSDLIPFSAPVSVPNTDLYLGFASLFDFATDATPIDFTSQSLTLSPSTEYYLLAQHNGLSSGTLRIYLDVSAGTLDGNARVSVNSSLTNPTIDPDRDAAFLITGVNVPEPGATLLLAVATLLFVHPRRRS